MNRIEELENAIKAAEELSRKFNETCVKVSCSDCMLKEGLGECAAPKHRAKLYSMRDELREEQKKAAGEKDIEDMIRAMQSVKRDEWEIVKIAYPDNTKAVAFIRKDADVQENMEEVKEEKKYYNDNKTRLDEAFRIANELANSYCPMIDCKYCPFNVNKLDSKIYSCVSIFAKRQLERIGKGPKND